jgi:hypothetical protein
VSVFNITDPLVPTLADEVVEMIPEGMALAEILDTFSGVLASFIIHSAETDRELSLILKTVQSDLQEKVFGSKVH